MADSPTHHPVDSPPSHLSCAENWISVTLRAGVLVSLLLIVVGTLITFLHHPQYVASKTRSGPPHQRPARPSPTRSPEVAAGIAALRGQAIVAAGLLVLIATPVLRVAISILVFLDDGDYPFVLITTSVLVILLISFLLGTIE